ncbi:hypothetical protein CDD82_6768 [Ophiocordyceps australis]|uniref:Nucleolar pre-ribosomal-associated protein 1 C-terminal domain-containing protein n=1 Tax=Ophiocordyceps australis TaxID=1399860 RepID=A0A2C5YUP6_9HYPO|nr:hypothetical protein CDD82_6768 [Ophiocordyceps australis]
MEKRRLGGVDGAAPLHHKRRKVVHESPTSEQVVSCHQLRRLLAFDQDLLLDGIDASTDNSGKEKLVILQQYLEAAVPSSLQDNHGVALSDVMETWVFAVQIGDEGIMSSVAVVLALLLRIVSTRLHLVPHGLAICKTLLQQRQLECLAKNLSANKAKAFIISPTLRLLRELACLDGGTYAKSVLRAKDYTLASLGRNVELGHVSDGAQQAGQNTSVRTNAIRFLLGCFKFVHWQGRNQLLLQKDLVSHVTFMLRTDPPQLVVEILDTLKTCVLMDSKIPRASKFKTFNTKTLLRVLALYAYASPHQPAEHVQRVRDKAHEFLLYACTTPVAGILCPCKGFYPKPPADGSLAVDGHEQLRDGAPPVFNFALSEFARKLRPWSSLQQNRLLVAMFAAAPELVADYFYHASSFTFDPKLSMTWVGYAAFLFDTMSLELPPAFGDGSRFATTPPRTSVLLDNILAPPITHKVIVRCFAQSSSHLTSLFAARILIVALEKLATACEMHQASRSRRQNDVWCEATRRLVDAFCQRMPSIKLLVGCYTKIPAQNALHRLLMSRLLRLYYQVIPRMTREAKLNASPVLAQLVKQVDQGAADSDARAWNMLELENMVCVANHSLGMKWFSKLDGAAAEEEQQEEEEEKKESLSAWTALLRLLCCRAHDQESCAQFQQVLTDVGVQHQVLSPGAGLRPLLRCLRCAGERRGGVAPPVWEFLDKCVCKCAASPKKYLVQMRAGKAEAEEDGEAACLLLAVFVEQLGFVKAAHDGAALACFVSLYFNACVAEGNDERALAVWHARAWRALQARSASGLAALGNSNDVEALKAADTRLETPPAQQDDDGPDDEAETDEAYLARLLAADAPSMDRDDDDDASALAKWPSKRDDELIDDAWAARLIRLLASPHVHLRKEALVNIHKLSLRIQASSSLDAKTQLHLVLSQLVESCRPAIHAARPVPAHIPAFACHALALVSSPLHPLYPKLNAFLTRSPCWDLDKFPLAHHVLHAPPGHDAAFYPQVAWLVAYLLDALRSPADLLLLVSSRWLEKILVVGACPYAPLPLRRSILGLVLRAARLPGGAATLVSRASILGWLRAQAAAAPLADDAPLYLALARRIACLCGEARLEAWRLGLSSHASNDEVDG